ncbi:cortex morphogenetic protein CmpA [Paenibacillus sp. N4]|nr:cortex morphogenetic protein CmpA [Paenibacillus vietnamensis]MCA0755722.1 cortex morphogenetic protein CmpA [Paenibacillus vietnamensis]
MPQWLCNQLMRAFLKKDRRQIKLLNDCWYFYRSKQGPKEQASITEFH